MSDREARLRALHEALRERILILDGATGTMYQRYGLEDNQFRTLAQVGKGMDLSRERVRQIEREALIRLKEHAKIREQVA